jgi:hypothetical protein
MTTGGVFSRIPFSVTSPPSSTTFTPGADATMWIVDSRGVLTQIGAHGVVRTVTLPNATDRAVAMTTGCDGALYVAESVPQIARIATDGRIEEYPLDVFSVDGITRAPDCSLWFTAGSNAPDQQIGRPTLLRRR